jgi:hypothetical protein
MRRVDEARMSGRDEVQDGGDASSESEIGGVEKSYQMGAHGPALGIRRASFASAGRRSVLIEIAFIQRPYSQF